MRTNWRQLKDSTKRPQRKDRNREHLASLWQVPTVVVLLYCHNERALNVTER